MANANRACPPRRLSWRGNSVRVTLQNRHFRGENAGFLPKEFIILFLLCFPVT